MPEPDFTDETRLYLLGHVIPAAYSLLPGKMNSPEATAELLAIGLTESLLKYRRQISGPAHGFWQFESGGGVKGVLQHPLTKDLARTACSVLRYKPEQAVCYNALPDNDVLACIFARLLLWTGPAALPLRTEPEKGWKQYLSLWRPGKPHPSVWPANFAEGWRLVSGE